MPNQTTQTYALSMFQAVATRVKARSRAKARQEQEQEQERKQGKEHKKEQSCSFYHSLLSSLQTNQHILVAQFIKRLNPNEIMGQSG
jgi:hypothetical protein